MFYTHLFAFKRNLIEHCVHIHSGISFRHVRSKPAWGSDDKRSMSYKCQLSSLEELVSKITTSSLIMVHGRDPRICSSSKKNLKKCHCRIANGHIWKGRLRQRHKRNERQRSPPEKSNVTGSRIHICDLIKNTKSKHENGSNLMEAIFLNSSQTLPSVGTGYTEHLQDGTGCRGSSGRLLLYWI